MQVCFLRWSRVPIPFARESHVSVGGSINAEQLNSHETVYRRAAGVIYKLIQDMLSSNIYQHTNWDIINHTNKLGWMKLFYGTVSEKAPPKSSYFVNKPSYNLRNRDSYFLKNTVGYRGATLQNDVCPYYTGGNSRQSFVLLGKALIITPMVLILVPMQ